MPIFLPMAPYIFMDLFAHVRREPAGQPVRSAEAFVSPFLLGSIFLVECLILTVPTAKDSDTSKGNPDPFILSFPDKPACCRSVH